MKRGLFADACSGAVTERQRGAMPVRVQWCDAGKRAVVRPPFERK